MKKSLFLFLTFLTGCVVFAQEFSMTGCGTNNILMHTENFNRQAIVQPSDTDLTTPYVFNVYFTLIKNQELVTPKIIITI